MIRKANDYKNRFKATRVWEDVVFEYYAAEEPDSQGEWYVCTFWDGELAGNCWHLSKESADREVARLELDGYEKRDTQEPVKRPQRIWF